MQIGSLVTIHTYERQWKRAKIVATSKDIFTGEQDIFIVEHPHFGQVHFYQQTSTTQEHEGQHLNVGNAAYWMMPE